MRPAANARRVPQWPNGTLLSRLTPVALAHLLALGTPRRTPAGTVLLREGDLENHIVLLLDAVTKVTAALPDGREALMSIRLTGDIVGEMSALNDEPRSATVTTCGPATVCTVSAAGFRSFLTRHPDAAIQVAGNVADRLRWANQRRVDFASYPAKVRLARVLTDIAQSYGRRTPRGIEVAVRLTQQDLATITGTADVTVQKSLHALRRQGLVSTGQRRLVVLDLPGLREFARLDEPDPLPPAKPGGQHGQRGHPRRGGPEHG